MTLPNRGLWRNSVLSGVLMKHKDVAQKNTGVKEVQPVVGHPMHKAPPAHLHSNSHVKAHVPGVPKDQHPGPREPRASKNAGRQAHATRRQLKFIPGTASALTEQIKANAKGVGEV